MMNRPRTRMAMPFAALAATALLVAVATPAQGQTQQPLRSGVTSMDRMMLGMLTRANEREIAQAKDILSSTHDAGVKRLANRMVKDHSAALTRERSLISRLGYDAIKDTTMAPGSTGNRTTDEQFVDTQVEAHRNLLNRIRLDQTRLRDDALKHHVKDVEHAVQTHLEMALRLQRQMNPLTLR